MSDFLNSLLGSSGRYGGNMINALQAQQISEMDQMVDQAKSQANRATERSIEAEMELERLRLVTQAMWEFLREHLEVTDADLEARIQEIDLRDGLTDGKMGRQVALCGQCHRKTGVRPHRRCFYCGASLAKAHIVER